MVDSGINAIVSVFKESHGVVNNLPTVCEGNFSKYNTSMEYYDGK